MAFPDTPGEIVAAGVVGSVTFVAAMSKIWAWISSDRAVATRNTAEINIINSLREEVTRLGGLVKEMQAEIEELRRQLHNRDNADGREGSTGTDQCG